MDIAQELVGQLPANSHANGQMTKSSMPSTVSQTEKEMMLGPETILKVV